MLNNDFYTLYVQFFNRTGSVLQSNGFSFSIERVQFFNRTGSVLQSNGFSSSIERVQFINRTGSVCQSKGFSSSIERTQFVNRACSVCQSTRNFYINDAEAPILSSRKGQKNPPEPVPVPQPMKHNQYNQRKLRRHRCRGDGRVLFH